MGKHMTSGAILLAAVGMRRAGGLLGRWAKLGCSTGKERKRERASSVCESVGKREGEKDWAGSGNGPLGQAGPRKKEGEGLGRQAELGRSV